VLASLKWTRWEYRWLPNRMQQLLACDIPPNELALTSVTMTKNDNTVFICRVTIANVRGCCAIGGNCYNTYMNMEIRSWPMSARRQIFSWSCITEGPWSVVRGRWVTSHESRVRSGREILLQVVNECTESPIPKERLDELVFSWLTVKNPREIRRDVVPFTDLKEYFFSYFS
jgi:hypothetical protein